MEIKMFTFNGFQENTYLLYDDSKECVIVDAGCYETFEQKELVDFVAQNHLTVKALWSTHGHIDHVLGNSFCAKHFGVKLYAYEDDVPTHLGVKNYAHVYGFPKYSEKEPDVLIPASQKSISFGNTTLEIIFSPGHAPGHIVFYHAESKNLINGDVLFQRSIGRTDLPGGDYDTLIHSIQKKLFLLPDDTIVHCGHGPSTTIGDEKKYNPFCAIK